MDLNKRLKRSTGGIGGSNTTRWFFVLPAMAIVICLLIYPLMSTLVYSFTNKTMTKTTFKVIGLTNYINVLKDPAFFAAFGHSLLWTAGSVLGQVIVGFAGALSLNRIKNKKVQNAFRICAIIPWAFPAIATAMVWKWMLNGIYGFIPTVLMNLGITDNMPQFLSTSRLAMPTLIFINIWFGAPMILVNVFAALQTIPQDQYEAAQIDGATSRQTFFYITAPHIRTVVGLLVVLRTVWVFNNFDMIYMITAGGPAGASSTMPLYIYDTGWTGMMVGKASAASMLLLMFLILLCILYFLVINRWEKEER
ncbi:MAG: sugar ABC transporter permease [Hungatella sp.]|nr:sugar ABC transporter permease [Hungatella sp.]